VGSIDVGHEAADKCAALPVDAGFGAAKRAMQVEEKAGMVP
jgi:hypothetical protein